MLNYKRIVFVFSCLFVIAIAKKGKAQNLQIGDSIFGGRIAYFLQPGDKNYDATKVKGFVAAPFDQSQTTTWGCDSVYIVGADSTSIGSGEANTLAIIGSCSQQGIAAQLCADLVVNGYSDWFLPSKYELMQLRVNQAAIGGFCLVNPMGWTQTQYWSSSQFPCPNCVPGAAATINMFGWFGNAIKNGTNGPAVRAIRNFCVIYNTTNINSCSNYSWHGKNYLKSGVYHDTLTGSQGCDTIAFLNLTIFNKDTTTIVDTFCTSKIINGQFYAASGTFTQMLTNKNNCDSLIILNLTVKQPSSESLTITDCGSYTLNGQTYYQSGQYQQLLTNHVGCDSTINLNLTIHPIDTVTVNMTDCDQVVYAGQTYTTGGTYIYQLQNKYGCDSIVTFNLILNHNSSATMTGTVCDSFEVNGIMYTTSGTNTQLLTNHAGCDSFLIITLNVIHASYKSITASACKKYTFNNQAYTTSGIYTQQLTNHVNCDSIIQLHLTINDTSTYTITNSSCKSLTYNGVTYDTTGTYKQTMVNYLGCDSVLKLNLTIPKINTSISKNGNTLTVNTTGASYQWVNCQLNYQKINGKISQTFTPTVSGSYAVIVTKNGCKDTSACFSIVVNEIETISNEIPIKIYRNSNEELTIVQLGNAIFKEYVLYNYLGELQSTGNLNPTNTSLTLKDLASGLYILKIGNQHFSIIKN
jgi:hypothetical protein